jgi:protein-S-isoprenylcysteine O-methyltransferase Ste14
MSAPREKSLFRTEKEDRLFVVLASLVFFLSLLVSSWDFVKVQGLVFHLNISNISGSILFFIGCPIRVIGKRTLGKYYSYGLKTSPNQKLIMYGMYKHIRHPINLAAIMYSLGIPLILSSLYGFFIMLWLIPLILYRIRIEERMLIQRFGNQYLEYMKRTKRLIPFIY